MARLIKPDGTTQERIEPTNRKVFMLAEMQKYVGGYIEFVYLPNDEIMVVNEEGLLKGLPFNDVASLIAKRTIVGDALIINSDQIT